MLYMVCTRRLSLTVSPPPQFVSDLEEEEEEEEAERPRVVERHRRPRARASRVHTSPKDHGICMSAPSLFSPTLTS